jgi:hypothetical protein
MSIILLGEHDKGTGCAFSPGTVSGRRLRRIIGDIGLECTVGNVFSFYDGTTATQDLVAICKSYSLIIALGKIAAKECARQGITAIYLPHPAVRSQSQLSKLKEGLSVLKNGCMATGHKKA